MIYATFSAIDRLFLVVEVLNMFLKTQFTWIGKEAAGAFVVSGSFSRMKPDVPLEV